MKYLLLLALDLDSQQRSRWQELVVTVKAKAWLLIFVKNKLPIRPKIFCKVFLLLIEIIPRSEELGILMNMLKSSPNFSFGLSIMNFEDHLLTISTITIRKWIQWPKHTVLQVQQNLYQPSHQRLCLRTVMTILIMHMQVTMKGSIAQREVWAHRANQTRVYWDDFLSKVFADQSCLNRVQLGRMEQNHLRHNLDQNTNPKKKVNIEVQVFIKIFTRKAL